MAHTKGNWTVSKKEPQQSCVVFADNKAICNIKWELPEFSNENLQLQEEAEANSKLIAAAPKMLSNLEYTEKQLSEISEKLRGMRKDNKGRSLVDVEMLSFMLEDIANGNKEAIKNVTK